MRELKAHEVNEVSGGYSPIYLTPITDIELGGIVGAPNPQPWPPIDIIPQPINQHSWF